MPNASKPSSIFSTNSMQQKVNLDAIPAILKEYRQWVVWKYEQKEGVEKPTKPLYSPKTGWRTSHHPKDADKWGTFDECVALLHHYDGIGFVLTEDDPFCVIDLDKAKQASDSDLQNEFWDRVTGYAETSPSGVGAHIWLRGSVPQGRKRYSTEIYSSLRYITVTGFVLHDGDIPEDQDMVEDLWNRLAPPPKPTSQPAIRPSEATNALSDEETIERAMNAANGDKFRSCWYGDFNAFDYPSASEADYALINMIAFYTHDDEQVKRIFLGSPAGRRDGYRGSNPNKYKGNSETYYLNRMIATCRDKTFVPPEVDMMPIMANIQRQIGMMKRTEIVEKVATIPKEEYAPTNELFPPGLIGEIAQAIRDYAPRPVDEIALIGAIGWMAGICGRCYNIAGAGKEAVVGLNLYLLLVAKSGVGKEQMDNGCDMIYTELGKLGVNCDDFIGPMKVSSEQALLQKLSDSRTKSLLSIYGEFSEDLQKMSSVGNQNSAVDMNKLLLTMYSSSGEGKVVKSVIYADKAKNTEPLKSPAYSFIGQSTPGEMYKGINKRMIEKGLIPRFVFFDYDGPRPPLNMNTKRIDSNLTVRLADLVTQSIMLNEHDKVINLRIEADAMRVLLDFNAYCDDWINKSDVETVRSLWNRCHLNAVKLAGLVAVGCNPSQPVVTVEAAEWAVGFVKRSIRTILDKSEEGLLSGGDEISVGNNQLKVMNAVKTWFTKEFSASEKANKRYKQYREEGIVPLRYIQQRCCTMKIETLKITIESLVKGGDLMKVDNAARTRLGKKYKWANIHNIDIFTISEDYTF